MKKQGLTHIDENGNAKMVDISRKADSKRMAVARGEIRMSRDTLSLIQEGSMKKGDVITVAKIAGINAAKKTSDLIPLSHHLSLTNVDIDFKFDGDLPGIIIQARAETIGKTGVEMEALVAVSSAALTIYDMAKAVEKSMVISNIHLVEKRGGASGNILIDSSNLISG